MEKLPKMSFSQAMSIWSEDQKQNSHPGELHLDMAMLEKLAAHGGLEDCDEAHIEHLASCPRCLSGWAEICRREAENPLASAAADDWYGGGMMEAASSETDYLEPLELPSRCGRFIVRFFPDSETAGKGMVAVEIKGDGAQDVEGREATLCDSKGQVILQGMINGGRVARIIDDIKEFDLQLWSVSLNSVLEGTE